MTKARHLLRKSHIWLGWIVALPLLAWTLSGLVMVARPIEEVRGEHLIAEAPVLPFGTAPVPPQIGPRPVSTIRLEQRHDGPKWVIAYRDGETRLADGFTGRLLPPLSAVDARGVVEAGYTGDANIVRVERTSAQEPPLELRRKVDAWRVAMDDGTHFYVNAATGEIIARRTRWWRFYDFMWGLHIMDLRTREDTHNPLVIGLGVLALATTILALFLLPMTLRRRRER